MKVALDTNLPVCAETTNSADGRDTVVPLIRRLPQDANVVPTHVLVALCNVRVGKGGRSRNEARDALLRSPDTVPTVETSPGTRLMAADLSTENEMGIWDAVIVCAAARSGCRRRLSERSHKDFTWAGVTVVNPFSGSRHALLQAQLDEGAE